MKYLKNIYSRISVTYLVTYQNSLSEQIFFTHGCTKKNGKDNVHPKSWVFLLLTIYPWILFQVLLKDDEWQAPGQLIKINLIGAWYLSTNKEGNACNDFIGIGANDIPMHYVKNHWRNGT